MMRSHHSTVSLACQLGGERRRHSSPRLSSTSLFHPFDRWQTGRNSREALRPGRTSAPSLPLPYVHTLAPVVPNDRRQLFVVAA
jgi:hypothetical protein